MTPSRNRRVAIEVAVPLILVFSLIFLSCRSAGLKSSGYSAEVNAPSRKLVLGSRPPRCINKCMSCQPCEATLVIPHHQKKNFRESAHREDDSYYLLSWKCKCGNKLFQP